ncbi:hypothetical protein [Fictibacillus solisalsi]|uniref:hypothetical protein n=1 Tax=Fictibacillus solisalsi TaxID=459525 RepID=UPI0011144F8D|nr:hypothetical protein [Fictibacillus solisalsi]
MLITTFIVSLAYVKELPDILPKDFQRESLSSSLAKGETIKTSQLPSHCIVNPGSLYNFVAFEPIPSSI